MNSQWKCLSLKNLTLTLVIRIDHHVCHRMFNSEMNNAGPDVERLLTVRTLSTLGTLQIQNLQDFSFWLNENCFIFCLKRTYRYIKLNDSQLYTGNVIGWGSRYTEFVRITNHLIIKLLVSLTGQIKSIRIKGPLWWVCYPEPENETRMYKVCIFW